MVKTTQNSLLDGDVKLVQPAKGYRVSVDSVFLASCLEQKNGSKVLDMGCGIGAISLCLLKRLDEISVTGVEIQTELVKLAKQSRQKNNIDEISFNIIEADITKLISRGLSANSFDQVVMNPPYLEVEQHIPSPNQIKATANSGTGGVHLKDWMKAACGVLKNGGYLTLVQRADRLNEIINYLSETNFGSFVIYPLWSKAGQDAKRVIVAARKNKFMPLRLLPGVIVHQNNGDYTPDAYNILYKKHATLLWSKNIS